MWKNYYSHFRSTWNENFDFSILMDSLIPIGLNLGSFRFLNWDRTGSPTPYVPDIMQPSSLYLIPGDSVIDVFNLMNHQIPLRAIPAGNVYILPATSFIVYSSFNGNSDKT